MIVSVLGVEYSINYLTEAEDPYLKECDGYCDKTTRRIVVVAGPDSRNIGDFRAYQKKTVRHEIIHAFLNESGLQENFKHDTWGHEETLVDWMAIQFPKILEAFKEADCI